MGVGKVRGGHCVILQPFFPHLTESKTNMLLSITPEILRLMTELFLCVENLSQEWGLSEELMMGTLTSEDLYRWLQRGISNVAHVSIALGLDNFLAKTFIEEKVWYFFNIYIYIYIYIYIFFFFYFFLLLFFK